MSFCLMMMNYDWMMADWMENERLKMSESVTLTMSLKSC